MHILFVSSEVFPFAKTGGLADVAGILPQVLDKLGCKCSVILPLYRAVRKSSFIPRLAKSGIPTRMGPDSSFFNLYSIKYQDVDFFFIEKEEYFDRDYIYGTPQGDYPDNALRFGFFSKAVLSSAPFIGKIDILHLNDWQSGLIPLYLKLFYKESPYLKDAKTLFTIHNLAYQGLFKKEVMPSIDLPEEQFEPDSLEFYGKISFIKAGILHSDAISTVSEGYAREILTEKFGCGLDGLLRTRKKDLYGILNGVDYSVWNPRTDKFIYKNYCGSELGPKLECKKDLLKELGIKFDEKKPLLGMITRLAEQKGVDLVAEAMEEMLALGVNFVLLGTGDEKYIALFQKIQRLHKKEVSIRITFDDALAHKIEAGSDMFLIPSRYEPCGLNQMYSLKYATVPVVRAVGGLDDTIEEFNPATKKGNGFKFKEASSSALLEAIKKAVKVYKNTPLWNGLLKNCQSYDFSWFSSAKKYNELYNRMLSTAFERNKK